MYERLETLWIKSINNTPSLHRTNTYYDQKSRGMYLYTIRQGSPVKLRSLREYRRKTWSGPRFHFTISASVVPRGKPSIGRKAAMGPTRASSGISSANGIFGLMPAWAEYELTAIPELEIGPFVEFKAPKWGVGWTAFIAIACDSSSSMIIWPTPAHIEHW